GDHWVRMLELAVCVTYWWLPALGIVARQLRACEEACCDAAVVARRPQARRDYARLVLDVLEFASPLPGQAVPQATAMSAACGVEERLRTILHATANRRRVWPAGCVMGCAFALLPCGVQYEFATRPAATITKPAPAAE